jgi:hypothetical protein
LVATPGQFAASAAKRCWYTRMVWREMPFDLSLSGAAFEQRPDGGLQMWLQDVHSVVSRVQTGGK